MIDESAMRDGGQASFLSGEDDLAATTGRWVVTFAPDAGDPAPLLQSVAGVTDMASSGDFDGPVDLMQVEGSGGLYFPELSVAVVSADPSQARAIRAAESDGAAVLAVEPERVHHILQSTDYVRGYRDAVTDLSGRMGADGGVTTVSAPSPATYRDTPQATWGLQATRVTSSPYSGQGIKVAILDTGFTTAHPDFAGRRVTTQSFVPDESAEDGHGHGTHCTGTACGPRNPSGGPRYGIAYDAEIVIGKVLSNAGSGTDTQILAGIAWALGEGCQVISMSLGADVQQVSVAYEAVGRRVLAANSLIVAAAGNNARRHLGNVGFVGIPANSPSIMAIGAVDSALGIARFSARSAPLRGGQVDLAGPGVDVLSAWKEPELHRTINGTSMATPHVAGIAALWAEHTGLRGLDLWATLVAEAERLALPSLDVGGGLVSAPQ